MHTTTPIKSKTTRIVLLPLKPWKVSKGHHSHRGGAGNHGDRRMNRLRTRADQRRAALVGE